MSCCSSPTQRVGAPAACRWWLVLACCCFACCCRFRHAPSFPFAAGSTHLPGTARPFPQLDPFEAARVAQECVGKYSQLAPEDADQWLSTAWAGQVLTNNSSPVVAGPLVPKAGSSLLRVLFGDQNRPKSLTNLSVVLERRAAERAAAGGGGV